MAQQGSCQLTSRIIPTFSLLTHSTGIRLYICSRSGCCQADFVERYGKWAVVTGATDGIGQAIAKELARRGMSILLVGRNAEKLARSKALVEAEPNVGEVETVRIDLSDSSLDNFASIRRQIDPDNRDIGMLINNAGTFPSKFVRFNKFDMEDLVVIANLNMIAPLHMTRMIMPGMVSRGRGMVMNVSSLVGLITAPYWSIYSATKAFMNVFTHQLQIEYASHPIDIVLLTPGPVTTRPFNEATHRKSSIVPGPDEYATKVVAAMSARPSSFSGCILHGLMRHGNNMFEQFGLTQAAFRFYLNMNARNFELSPVPKRKNNSTAASRA